MLLAIRLAIAAEFSHDLLLFFYVLPAALNVRSIGIKKEKGMCVVQDKFV